MCLRTTDLTVKMAYKPIFCYKAGDINGNKIGPFTNYFHYEKGVQAPLIIITPDNEVHEGYHSFNSYRDICKEMKYADKGIFMIPAGTKYIDGEYNCDGYPNRVSSTIVYVAPCTLINRLKLFLGLLKIS